MVKNHMRMVAIVGCVLMVANGYAAYANEQLQAQEVGVHVPVIHKLAYDGDDEPDEDPSDAEFFDARELSQKEWEKEIEDAIAELNASQATGNGGDKMVGSVGHANAQPGKAVMRSGRMRPEPKSWVQEIVESNAKAELERVRQQEATVKELLQVSVELSAMQQEQLKMFLASETDSEESSD